jgi:hypothetical protein
LKETPGTLAGGPEGVGKRNMSVLLKPIFSIMSRYLFFFEEQHDYIHDKRNAKSR